jgi:hypothetical protein
MRYQFAYLGLGALLLGGMFIAGCSTNPAATDSELIQDLLLNSQYTNPDDGPGAFDDQSEDPYAASGPGASLSSASTDTLPWVRFVRKLTRPIQTYVEVEIPAPGAAAGTALATITHYPTGTFYVDNTENDTLDVISRPLDGVATRRVFLSRSGGGRWNGWRIDSLSALEHVSGQSTVVIDSIKAEGSSHTFAAFVINSASAFFSKAHGLATFAPGDEVTVTVWTHNAQENGSWAFLHRGSAPRRYRALRWHMRDPFYAEDASHTVFQKTWSISDDPVRRTPRVCNAAIDVIDWNTLFGDGTAYYNCRVWSLPYVVREADQPVPDDVE